MSIRSMADKVIQCNIRDITKRKQAEGEAQGIQP